MRRLIIGIVTLVTLLAASYASLPWLVNALLLPRLIDQAGLDALELEIGYPGLEHLHIARLHLKADSLTLDARNIDLSYSLQSLRSERLENIHMEALALTVLIPETGASSSPEPSGDIDPPALALETLLGRVPADRVVVNQLEVAVPSLDFLSLGTLALDPAGLSTRLAGLRPEIARDLELVLELDRAGLLALSLQDPDPELPSSIQLLGEPDGTRLSVQGEYSVSGYGLRLLQEISGIPQGTGRVSGELATSLPWPLVALPDWQTLEGSARLEIDWSLAEPSILLNDVTAAIELEQGEFRIRPHGTTSYSTGNLDITGTFTGGAFSYHDGRLSSTDPRLTLIARTPDLSTKADVHEVLGTDSPLTASLTSSVLIDHEAAQAEGELITTLAVDGETFDGDFKFDGELNTSTLLDTPALQNYPFQLDGNVVLLGDRLAANANLTAGPLAGLPFEVEHNLTNAKGTLTFSHTQAIREPVLQKLLPGWQEPYDIDSGEMAMNGELTWNDRLNGSITIEPQAVTAYYDDYTLLNAAGTLTFSITDSAVALLPSGISIEGIDIGTPVTGVELMVSGTPDRLNISVATAEVLGGLASIDPFDYEVETGNAEFSVQLSELDFAEVLALQGDSVSGNGRLSGSVPVTLRNNAVQIDGGIISAIHPGQIKLSPTLAAGITQPGLDIAVQALQNFNFEALSANVDYDNEGNMLLAVRLEGRNPDLENGRPVHFNLNISENIPVLLKSLRLQDNFTKTLERRVQQ